MAQDTDYKEKTGRDAPEADGAVSDEDVNAISEENEADKPTGQDHSLENYEETMPEEGVGAVQDASLIREDVARIGDEE